MSRVRPGYTREWSNALGFTVRCALCKKTLNVQYLDSEAPVISPAGWLCFTEHGGWCCDSCTVFIQSIEPPKPYWRGIIDTAHVDYAKNMPPVGR